MPKENMENPRSLSRREFLRNAGIVVGGSAVGSSVLLSACNSGGETTLTKTVTSTVNVTSSVAKFVCPYDSQEFDTFSALQTHVEAEHEAGDPLTKYVCPYDNQEFGSLDELKTHLNVQHLEIATSASGIVTLTINGDNYTLRVEPSWTLSYVLREKLGLTGTKVSCDEGSCGSCTIAIDGKPFMSCMLLAIECEGKSIETIESFSSDPKKQRLIDMFSEKDAVQCGFCTPGMVIASKLLLDKLPSPTEDDIKEELSGVLCRCGIQNRVVEAILALGGGD